MSAGWRKQPSITAIGKCRPPWDAPVARSELPISENAETEQETEGPFRLLLRLCVSLRIADARLRLADVRRPRQNRGRRTRKA